MYAIMHHLKAQLSKMPRLSIIIPCYNNALNIPVTAKALIENEATLPKNYEIEYIMVDDGSKDNTYQTLLNFKEEYPSKVKVIKLAGNVGSYNAFLAGMNYATGDCNVHLHADLQDPPALIAKMLEHWEKGNKLVIANRTNRDDPFFSKLTGSLFHVIFRRIGLQNAPSGGFDLMLFDKQLREQIVAMNEKNAHQVYLFLWMNYPYVSIPYERQERELGQSQWKWGKKFKLMIDTIIGFSYKPIRWIWYSGLLISLISIALWLFEITNREEASGLFSKNLTISASIYYAIFLVCGILLTAIGILGEYLWRTLEASRNRPNFIVDEQQ